MREALRALPLEERVRRVGVRIEASWSHVEPLRRLLAARHKPVVRFRDWKRIEAEEERRGGGIRPRVKITRRDELLAIAGAHPPKEQDDGTRDLRSSAAE